MIIISKNKDYYDYLQGIYGRDELKVYQRSINPSIAIQSRDGGIIEHSHKRMIYDAWEGYTYYNRWDNYFEDKRINCFNVYDFYICGRHYVIEVVQLDGAFHYVPLYQHPYNGDCKKLPEEQIIQKEYPREIGKSYKLWIATTKNHELRKPIILDTYDDVPMLSKWNFSRILKVEELYAELDIFLGWLNDKPQMPVLNMTEKEKLSSKGFNTQSFKHRKKVGDEQ
ncbi:MAG: hypothetical protein KGV50_05390 [Gammaproteobacteria bacterium]|nr:hypothetical protein [Gammaproteobacteria bacterium]